MHLSDMGVWGEERPEKTIYHQNSHIYCVLGRILTLISFYIALHFAYGLVICKINLCQLDTFQMIGNFMYAFFQKAEDIINMRVEMCV